MAMFEKSSLSAILTESYIAEANTSDDINIDADVEELENDYEDIEEIEEETMFTAEMVPVIECGDQFEVDYNDLKKLMDCCHKDEKECLGDVCDHCGIELDKTYVVIDSDEVMEECVEDLMTIIKEAKSPVKKNKAKLKLKNTKNLFKNLINKGIQVKKRKSKSKPAKRKKK